MVPGYVGRSRHQLPGFERLDASYVVRNQAVAPFDQSQNAFAFSHSALSADEHADAKNIDHAAELCHRRREIEFKRNRGCVDKLHRYHRCAKNRHTRGFSDCEQLWSKVKTSRNNNARDFRLAEGTEAPLPLLHAQALEVGLFGCTQNLHSLLGKIGIETGQREAGTVDGRFSNSAIETPASAFQLELQFLGMTLEKRRDRHYWYIHPLCAIGTDRLHSRSLRVHLHRSFIANSMLSQPGRKNDSIGGKKINSHFSPASDYGILQA